MNIRLFKPSIGKDEFEAVKDVFNREWIGLGPKVNEFENAWKKFLGCDEAIALNSATAALHLALKVFNFPKKKKVLVPSLTFSSTASSILYNDLIPVFIDSNPSNLGMDFDDLEAKYDSDCVAVMPVHYAGHPAQMERIVPWARKKGIKIIEDCAHTTGSEYLGKSLGLWGDISCFSFEEKKLMTTGDGGMICSRDKNLLKDVRAMRWVGIDKDNWKTAQNYVDKNQDAMHWFYELKVLGFKYNMNDLAASLGLTQLKKINFMNEKRANSIKKYLKLINEIDDVKPLLNYEPDNYVYHIFGIRVPNKDATIIHLKNKGIATGCHYTPLSIQPLFSEWGNNCPYIESEINKCITLPLHTDLKDQDIEYICNEIKNSRGM